MLYYVTIMYLLPHSVIEKILFDSHRSVPDELSKPWHLKYYCKRQAFCRAIFQKRRKLDLQEKLSFLEKKILLTFG